ncbi:hypothetical protein Smic_60620 [Streptomyces microflavus]|uniref:Uncharacterized protein n=1 Tax=Streptomyces microflavus TaxID=1919 RepID=A0A7J0CY99_STRMI|nr:hypothetical protein Smic_60620 [Streptomyces microflavus]
MVGGGATVFFGGAGVLLAGAVLFFGAVAGAFDSLDGVAAGFLEGVAEGAADFDGVFEALPEGDFDAGVDGDFEGVFEGAPGRSLPRLAGEEERSAGALEPPCWVSRSGAPPVRTWSAAELPPEV